MTVESSTHRGTGEVPHYDLRKRKSKTFLKYVKSWVRMIDLKVRREKGKEHLRVEGHGSNSYDSEGLERVLR